MSKVPFISITDFTTGDQVRAMCAVMDECRTPRKLGVGVMMSYKTLHGLPTKWSNAFPKNETIPDIFINDSRVFNVLHYADYNNDSSGLDFVLALDHCGPNVHAIQFDMPWPDCGALHYAVYRARNRRLPIDIILQVGANAMKKCDDDPDRVVEKLRQYRNLGILDYVLLDKSMGKGVGMDAALLLSFIRPITKAFPDLGIVVAGGLGPMTTHLVDPILAEFPDVSLDAQGQLRQSGNALDPIEWGRAAQYLRNGSALCNYHNKQSV